MRRLLAVTVTAVLIVGSVCFALGLAVAHFRWWPFETVSRAYRTRGAAVAEERFEKQLNGLRPLRANDLTRVSSPELVTLRRRELVDFIWPSGTFPAKRLPDEVRVGIRDSVFSVDPEVQRITSLTTTMRHGVSSTSYYLEPVRGRGCLMIYHHGHADTFYAAKPVIDRILATGCAVLAFSMPLAGDTSLVVQDSSFGAIRLRRHDDFRFLEAPGFSPIAYFLEPVAAALNYATRGARFDRIGMAGFSGGGWTTTLYAALDERIARSYPVAGSEPIWLMLRRPEGLLDYEQTLVDLYRRTTYPELYVMATSKGRSQLQILNRFDACCFYGRGYLLYEDAVRIAAKKQGGEFRVFLDESHREHTFSSAALDSVLTDFLRSPAIPTHALSH